jgi:hypothetical protein
MEPDKANPSPRWPGYGIEILKKSTQIESAAHLRIDDGFTQFKFWKLGWMIGRKPKPKTQDRPRSSGLRERAVSFALLVAIMATAVATSYLFLGPLVHPNLHPRLVRFGIYLAHHHPRLMKAMPGLLLSLVVVLNMTKLLAPIWWQYQSRKRGLLNKPSRKNVDLLDQTIKETYPLLLPQAWSKLRSSLPGLLVKVPDLRATHWELVEVNEYDRQLRLIMHYVHDPLYTKYWRVYPRRISCVVKLAGKGVRSVAEFTYHADSVMDYRTVTAIIEQTISQVKAAIEDNGPPFTLAELPLGPATERAQTAPAAHSHSAAET